jgi:hypothetical protein
MLAFLSCTQAALLRLLLLPLPPLVAAGGGLAGAGPVPLPPPLQLVAVLGALPALAASTAS